MVDKSYDSAVAWQNSLGEMDRGFNSFANQAMDSSGFSRAMNQVSVTSIGAQKALGEVMEPTSCPRFTAWPTCWKKS